MRLPISISGNTIPKAGYWLREADHATIHADGVQEWSDTNTSHTDIPFERKYMMRNEPGVDILKQNIGQFTLNNGAAVHIQSFGIFNMTLWDDVMAQFMPLAPNDIILVGKATAQNRLQ